MFSLLATVLVVSVIGWLLLRSSRPLVENTESHWHQTVAGLLVSPPDFYSRIESKLSEWEVPNVRVERVEVQEGAAFSNKRLYLRVRREDLAYDIFTAPFGGGLFVSAWLWREPSPFLAILGGIPWIGRRLVGWLAPETFYAVDTAILFQETTHSAVLSALDELISQDSLKPIPEAERKPIMRELYAATIVPKAPAAR